MTDTLLIFLEKQSYTQDSGTEKNYDTTIIGDLVDADLGYAVTDDGEPLQYANSDRRSEDVFEPDYYVQTSTVYNERFCVSDPDRFSDTVELFDGERVSPGDYDVVLISHFWMHHYYLDWLMSRFPETTFVGIQEESVQDIAGSASRLQATHFETIERLDGLVALNEQYRRWIEPHRPNVMQMPLPIPKGQFEGYESSADGRNAACVGVGTWNLDNANFYTNVRVLDRLRRNGADLDGEIVGIRDWQEGAVEGLESKFDYVTTRGFIDEGLYDHLAEFELAIIMTTRATAGKMALDFAGVGVPCIGNVHNAFQARCWPELSVDPYDVPQAVALGERLLEDEEFYEATVRRAQREVSALQDHDRFEERLRQYLSDVHGE